jgi:hypothetical protein
MEFTEYQAKDVISNPENPHYQAFYSNREDVVVAVNRAFSNAHPGEVDLEDNPALTDAMAKALNLQTPGGKNWFTELHRKIFTGS